MNIERLDFNLFKILVAIYEERQVTAAAARLGMTQPGLSHALSRLRDLVGDELFVRRPGGMVPTAAAEDLYARVRPGLQLVQERLSPPARLEPETLRRTFILGMNDYGASIVLPQLIRRMAASAPGVRLKTRHYAHGTQYEDLRSGDIDLSITVVGDQPGWTSQEVLFEETAMVVAAAGNPHIRGTVTMEAYLACPHVIMAPDGVDRNWVDEVLSEHGLQRVIQHTVPHFLSIPPIIRQTAMISTLPRRIALSLGRIEGLRAYELPYEPPPHRIIQVWPRRMDRDPLHQWLRAEVRAACTEID